MIVRQFSRFASRHVTAAAVLRQAPGPPSHAFPNCGHARVRQRDEDRLVLLALGRFAAESLLASPVLLHRRPWRPANFLGIWRVRGHVD
jgi:hypothetical protein